MREWFIQYAAGFSERYLILQVIVILAIFILGFLALASLSDIYPGCADDSLDASAAGTVVNGDEINKQRKHIGYMLSTAIRAFPTGLAIFIIEAYIMLVVGIRYNTWSVIITYVITLAAFHLIGIKNGKIKAVIDSCDKSMALVIGVGIVVLAYFFCMGIVPISISNDSMYYFHEYPRDIVYFGALRDQFDTFLTDTGLGSVVIDTLPFLFGFNESFGIRAFMHYSFIGYFMLISFKIFARVIPKEKVFNGHKLRIKAFYLAVLAGLIMATASPVFILGHWAMANMYFMEFFFIGAYEMYALSEKITSQSLNDGAKESLSTTAYIGDMVYLALICVACSLIRIEGGIFMAFLLLTITLLNVSDLQVSLMITLPIMLLTGGYALKIFASYTIDNPYTFLSPVKSLLQVVVFAGLIVYSAIIKKLLPDAIRRFAPALIMAGLLFVNILLLLVNRGLYIANLKAFYRNLAGQSGWGMLPYAAAASIIMLIVLEIADRIKGFKMPLGNQITYFSVLTIGFILVTIAVSFARGDELMQQVGDSGNRVLLQLAPLLIFTIILYFVRAYERIREDK